MPAGDRKSGMPLSVEMPAPVRTTHGCRSRTRAARTRMGSAIAVECREMGGFRFSTEVTVRFAETDAQGVAHNSAYLVWFEVARIAYLAEYAGGYPALRAQGLESFVLESHVRYHRPAHFDDRLSIHARIGELRGARFRFDYEITRDGEADADDRGLAAVGGVEEGVVEQLAARVVDLAADARRPGRLAGLLDDPLADKERGVGNPLHRGPAGDLERRGLADDAPVNRRPVEGDRQRRGTDPRPYEEPVSRVVDEFQIDVGIVDGGVPALRVVADVERVVGARDDRQAGLVRGVEDGRRDLADTAAEAGLQLAVDDDGRFLEALVGRASSGRLVEGEGLAGRDHVLVDQV